MPGRRFHSRKLLLAAALQAIGARNLLADSSWITNRVGSWSVSANWVGGVPQSGGIVSFGSGVGNIDQPFNPGTLTLAGGTIEGPGFVSISKLLSWQAGNLEGDGTFQISSGATMNASMPLNQSTRLFRSISNFGTLNWSATASLETGGGAVLDNHGTLNFTSDSTFAQQLGPTPQYMLLANSGTLTKSAGSGSTSFQGHFFNTGTILVQQGTLNIVAKSVGTSEAGSTIDIAPAATLQIGGVGVWLKNGTTVTGAGTLECVGGARAQASVLAAHHILMNGTELAIDGASADLDTSSFTWNRGFLSGAGVTRLSSDITFSQGWGVIAGRVLDTNGFNLTWDGNGFGGGSNFGFFGAGTIENRAASTLTFFGHSRSTTTLGTGNSAAVLNNAGTVDLHNAGGMTISRAVTNTGTIKLSSGTYEDAAHVVQVGDGSLNLSGGIASSGAIVGTGSLLIGANSTFSAGSTIDVTGLRIYGGTTTLSSTGPTAYHTSGTTTLINSAQLNLAPGVTHSAGGIELFDEASIDLNGGNINAGTIAIGRVLTGDLPVLLIRNAAQLACGTLTVGDGTLDVQSGTISAGTFAVAGGTVNLSPAASLASMNLELTGGAINVSPGFAWPTTDFSTDGSAINLKSGVSYSFAAASVIAAGGVSIESGASLHVDSMQHSGISEVRGTLAITHDLALTNFGQITIPGGTLSARNISVDGYLFLSQGTIAANGAAGITVPPAGAIVGAGTITGSVHSAGAIIPGEPTGTLAIGGALDLQPDSQLFFQINAGPAIDAARIDVAGEATLNGTLAMQFVSSNVLLPNQAVQIMHWQTHAGTFTSFVFDQPFPGLSYTLDYAADHLSIVPTALGGDANLDGVTNALDFNAIASHFGQVGPFTWLDADFTGDSIVNSCDFSVLAAHFNESLPAPGSALETFAPEPSPAVFMFLGVCRRRRR